MNAQHDKDSGLSSTAAFKPSAATVDARVAQALDELRAAWDAGQKIDRAELLSKYRDVAEPLAECLESLDLIDDLPPEMATSIAADLLDEDQLDDDAHLPHLLGDYRLIRQIGAGGMGIVFEAEQVSLGRRVALKVLPFAPMLEKKYRRRFENEARLAGMLDHPNIVGVHAVGVERGVHYYAMHYIEGQSLADTLGALRRLKKDAPDTRGPRRSDEKALPDAATLQSQRRPSATPAGLGTTPTEQGTYRAAATSRLLEDLISTDDRSDRRAYIRIIAEYGVQIAEGLAHAHDKGILHRDIKPANLLLDATGNVWITDFGLARLEQNGRLTTSGDVLGTLRYMSPEQALGLSSGFDCRSDVYSLGATLYELFTLQPVFAGRDRQKLLNQIASQQPLRLRQIDKRIPRELETVILKALEKHPRDRYATVRDFARDLKCFLACEPIMAKPPKPADRLSKWARRHRSLVWLAVLFLIVSTVGIATGTALVTRARYLTQESNNRVEDVLYARDMALAFQAWDKRWTDEAMMILRRHIPGPEQTDRRGFEWFLLDALVRESPPLVLESQSSAARDVAFSPDGQRLAVAWANGLCCGDPAAEVGHSRQLAADTNVSNVAYSPRGDLLATCTADSERITLWTAAGPKAAGLLTHKRGAVKEIGFSPDGQWLASTGEDGVVHVWEVEGQREIDFFDLPDHGWAVTFSPNGRYLVSGGQFTEIIVYDLPRSEICMRLNADSTTEDVAFSPDGQLLASAHADARIRLWEVASGRLLAILWGHEDSVNDLSFSSGGRTLASASSDGTVRLWSVGMQCQFGVVEQRSGTATAVAFAPDGRSLVAGFSATPAVLRWKIEHPQWQPPTARFPDDFKP